MALAVLISLTFLTVIMVGFFVAIIYSAMLFYKFWTGPSEEESISLLDAAKLSARNILTPVFGEYDWFLMASSALFLLTCRAGWQNFSKAVLQMHWELDDQVFVVIFARALQVT
jgi:hypothetical protein